MMADWLRTSVSIFKQPTAFSRRGFARVVQEHRPSKEEGAGNAGCPMHPRPRAQCGMVERTRVSTGSPESTRHSLRNGFTAYVVSFPATGLSCHRHPRIKVLSAPGWADLTSANLTPASGCQNNTILPYAAPVSAKGFDGQGAVRQRVADYSRACFDPPCNHVSRLTPPRPPHPVPRS